MKISYYLNEGRKKNLYCRISDGSERVSFSLGHTIDSKDWNEKKEEGSIEDPYYFTLMSLKEYLSKRYHEMKSKGETDILVKLKNEADAFIDGSGIEGIARKMFDDENEADQVYRYDQFIQAFQKYSNLERSKFQAKPVGNIVYFYIKQGDAFQMDTYEGLTSRLKSFIDGKSYNEILIETEPSVWSEIYLDAGIEKHVFLPKMLIEWERYWYKEYEEVAKSVGKTDHLNKMKDQSWRQFQVYMECYEGAGDVIKLAWEVNDLELYPIAVITMLNIFDAETCYQEYCELTFNNGEWESIDLSNEDMNSEEDIDSLIFYLRQTDE